MSRPMTARRRPRRSCSSSRALAVGGLLGARPREPARRAPVVTPAPQPRRRPADPQPVELPARRRPARPPDGVVVLHGPPRRRRRRAARVRVRRVPGGAWRVPGVLGVAPRPHRRDGRRVPLRPAQRDRPPGRPVPASARAGRPASRSRSRAPTSPGRPSRIDPVDDGRVDGHGPARGRGAAARCPVTPSEAFGLDLSLASRKPPALHDDDGWIDFGDAGGSYYYSRTAMTATGTVTLGDRTLASTGDAWFDHQWGDFISRRRWWLGLVRGQPRRRHGRHALARAGRRRHLPARVRDGRGARRHDPPPRPGGLRRRAPPTGRARRPAPSTRRAGRSGCRPRRSRSA